MIAESLIASFFTRLLTHPLDTIKTNIQTGSKKAIRWNKLYQGLPVALCCSVPAVAVYLSAYDLTKESLGHQDSILVHAASAIVAEISSGIFWTPMVHNVLAELYAV